jgi:phosphoribosylanthranilate isomerase
MALKTFVKVGKISNLSDARYCAGMGVDMLGFCVVSGQDQFVSPELFKEIRVWFSGPQVVAEAYGISSQQGVNDIIANYQPDLLELSLPELKIAQPNSRKCILFIDNEITTKHFEELLAFKDQIEFLLLERDIDKSNLQKLSDEFKIMLQVHSQADIGSMLENEDISAISLKGGAEERPGFKDYDQLSEIFEKLEAED